MAQKISRYRIINWTYVALNRIQACQRD